MVSLCTTYTHGGNRLLQGSELVLFGGQCG